MIINQSDFVQTRFEEFEEFGIKHGDMFGVLRCQMRIEYLLGYVKFDLPFVSSAPMKEQLVLKEVIATVVGLAACFVTLSLIVLLLFVYRRKEKRIAVTTRIAR